LHAAFPTADGGTKRTLTLRNFVACSLQNVCPRIAEQLLSGRVPEQNLAFERHHERCIRRSFEQSVHINGKHDIPSPGDTPQKA